MSEEEFRVIVAVGPDGIHDGTLDLVAEEAVRRGTGVELLHVVHSLVAGPNDEQQASSLDAALSEVGRAAVTSAASRLRERLDDRVPLDTQVRFGPVATTIAERAPHDGLIVLERRDAGLVERLLTMSVSTRVAAHAHAPVLVVPATWEPGKGTPLPVTVGVDHPIDALGQVAAALGYARDSGRPLTVLHAVWLAPAYQDIAFRNDTRGRWLHDAEIELEHVLADLPTDGVEVTREVIWGAPANALVGASLASAVVVLSRRRERAVGSHLGPLTRTVLQHAAGPVLVVDRT